MNFMLRSFLHGLCNRAYQRPQGDALVQNPKAFSILIELGRNFYTMLGTNRHTNSRNRIFNFHLDQKLWAIATFKGGFIPLPGGAWGPSSRRMELLA